MCLVERSSSLRLSIALRVYKRIANFIHETRKMFHSNCFQSNKSRQSNSHWVFGFTSPLGPWESGWPVANISRPRRSGLWLLWLNVETRARWQHWHTNELHDSRRRAFLVVGRRPRTVVDVPLVLLLLGLRQIESWRPASKTKALELHEKK